MGEGTRDREGGGGRRRRRGRRRAGRWLPASASLPVSG